jgi:hypothetical protein
MGRVSSLFHERIKPCNKQSTVIIDTIVELLTALTFLVCVSPGRSHSLDSAGRMLKKLSHTDARFAHWSLSKDPGTKGATCVGTYRLVQIFGETATGQSAALNYHKVRMAQMMYNIK